MISPEVPDYYNFSLSTWLQWFLLKYLIIMLSHEVPDYNDFSLKQQFVYRHVATLWHIILITSQPVCFFSLMLRV